ncbi:MAG: hypothetical protein ACRDIB_19195, partial [Ardenticatenaceae bacterium]
MLLEKHRTRVGTSRRWLSALLLALSIAFLFLAQYHGVYRRENVWEVILYWIAGLVAFFLLLRLSPLPVPFPPFRSTVAVHA